SEKGAAKNVSCYTNKEIIKHLVFGSTKKFRYKHFKLMKKFALQFYDVLERQGRSALLRDAVILAILGQPTVSITYELVECRAVAITLGGSSTIGIHL
ncbi:hypothetical protein KIN20_003761, partial [Parelaphostrongylus tenuis]